MELAARERQAKRVQLEHEIALREREEHIARLRALRLAKESDKRDRAGNASDANAAVEDEKSTR
jgi:hypothetical protein